MLRAAPTAWYSSNFRLFQNDTEVGLLKLARLKERASFAVKEVEFEMYREGLIGDFVLSFQGNILARADKTSVLTRTFEITVEEQRYVLEAESSMQRAFQLRAAEAGEDGETDGNNMLGRIAPEGVFTRRATIDLPDGVPLPVQAFCFWLVLVMWNRAAAAAS